MLNTSKSLKNELVLWFGDTLLYSTVSKVKLYVEFIKISAEKVRFWRSEIAGIWSFLEV